MTVKRLNSLALMNAHRDRLYKLETSEIIEKFIESGSRRLQLRVFEPISYDDQGSFYLLLIFFYREPQIRSISIKKDYISVELRATKFVYINEFKMQLSKLK